MRRKVNKSQAWDNPMIRCVFTVILLEVHSEAQWHTFQILTDTQAVCEAQPGQKRVQKTKSYVLRIIRPAASLFIFFDFFHLCQLEGWNPENPAKRFTYSVWANKSAVTTSCLSPCLITVWHWETGSHPAREQKKKNALRPWYLINSPLSHAPGARYRASIVVALSWNVLSCLNEAKLTQRSPISSL